MRRLDIRPTSSWAEGESTFPANLCRKCSSPFDLDSAKPFSASQHRREIDCLWHLTSSCVYRDSSRSMGEPMGTVFLDSTPAVRLH